MCCCYNHPHPHMRQHTTSPYTPTSDSHWWELFQNILYKRAVKMMAFQKSQWSFRGKGWPSCQHCYITFSVWLLCLKVEALSTAPPRLDQKTHTMILSRICVNLVRICVDVDRKPGRSANVIVQVFTLSYLFIYFYF